MGGHHDGSRHRDGEGHQDPDARIEQLSAEIAQLVTDATDESRSRTYRDWCARRIPHVQALLFARTDRVRGYDSLRWPRGDGEIWLHLATRRGGVTEKVGPTPSV